MYCMSQNTAVPYRYRNIPTQYDELQQNQHPHLPPDHHISTIPSQDFNYLALKIVSILLRVEGKDEI